MRSALVPVALLAASAAISAGCATAAPSSPAASPTIRLAGLVPARAQGANFTAGEDVRVTLRAGAAKLVRTAQASSAGSFTVGFGVLRKSDRCSGTVMVTAVSPGGERASYRLPPLGCTTESATPNSR